MPKIARRYFGFNFRQPDKKCGFRFDERRRIESARIPGLNLFVTALSRSLVTALLVTNRSLLVASRAARRL
jgi:hypothetical protein